jgi:hypothetical protein
MHLDLLNYGSQLYIHMVVWLYNVIWEDKCDWWVGMTGNIHGILWGTMPVFTWREWGRHKKHQISLPLGQESNLSLLHTQYYWTVTLCTAVYVGFMTAQRITWDGYAYTHQSWFNILCKWDSKCTKHAFHSLSHNTTPLYFLLNSSYSIINLLETNVWKWETFTLFRNYSYMEWSASNRTDILSWVRPGTAFQQVIIWNMKVQSARHLFIPVNLSANPKQSSIA